MAKTYGAFSQRRLARILRIHRLFRTGQPYSLTALAEACHEIHPGVDERTIAADIDFLRDELKAPLPEQANRWKPFRYEPGSTYSIFEGLDDSFAGTLDEVLALVRQLTRKPEFDGLEDLLLRLEQRAAQVNTDRSDVLQFDEPELEGRQYLLPLYRYILDGNTIELTYKPYKQEPSTFLIRPLLLRQFNHRWFLFAWREGDESLKTYALDRIRGHAKSMVSIARPPFNIQAYFEHLIGVSKGDVPVQVVLRFSPTRKEYVQTKKLHRGQQAEEQADGSLLVRLTVELNRELVARILEFGPDVQVLEPLTLRQQIRISLKQAFEQYD